MNVSLRLLFFPTMTTSNNSPFKIYCENIVGIFFLFLTQYKFKIFFLFIPSIHLPLHSNTSRLDQYINFTFFIFLFILFPQGFHFPRFNLHHTFKKNLCTKSAFNFYIFFPSFFFLTFISSITPTSQNML